MEIRSRYLPNPLAYPRPDTGRQGDAAARARDDADDRANANSAARSGKTADTGESRRPTPERVARRDEAETRAIYPTSTSPVARRALGAYHQNQGPSASEILVGIDEYA
jgi:hypothetical protein